MILHQVFFAAILICLTVIIHALALDKIMQVLAKLAPHKISKSQRLWKIKLIILTIGAIFNTHFIQVTIWALFYLYVEALPDFETCLYFSTSTFTTVGYGDLFLDKEWRLLSSLQSANGFILFGWSTAFIFEVMSKLYKKDEIQTN